MIDMVYELTRCEYAMWLRLLEEDVIYWKNISGNETGTLNRIVKKGYAILSFQGDPNDKYNMYWSLPE